MPFFYGKLNIGLAKCCGQAYNSIAIDITKRIEKVLALREMYDQRIEGIPLDSYLVEPSVPLSPILFRRGAGNRSGVTCIKPQVLDELVRRGCNREIFADGRRVSIKAEKER